MSFKPNELHLLLLILLTLLCASCSDDPDGMELTGDSGWISYLGIESHSGKLSINSSNEYIIVGSDYIMKVDADGHVVEEINDPFSAAESGMSIRTKVTDEKIYRFTSIGYSNEDYDKKIEVEIYDLNGNLLESKVLDATYVLIDAIIEDDRMTLVTWNWGDPNALGARTHIFQVDNNGEMLLENTLNSFPNITGRLFDLRLLEDGNFLFEYDNSLYKVNDKFEPISSIDLTNRIHEFMEGPNNNIYVGGVIPSDTANFILKLDKNLNRVNEITFNSKLSSPIHPSIESYAFGSFAIYRDNLYSIEVAYEYGQELRFQCFDLDLNKSSEFVLQGSAPFARPIINELGTVSFLYGDLNTPFDEIPDFTMPTEVRLFKLDANCQIPEETIIN